jgi:membrane associated rhomboid family serine protease
VSGSPEEGRLKTAGIKAIIVPEQMARYHLPYYPMDINHILFLIAILNLLGDLYNIIRFRNVIPRWVLPANVLSLLGCGAAKLLAPDDVGTISLGILLTYVLAIRLTARTRGGTQHLPGVATKLLITANACMYGFQVYRDAIDNPYEMTLIGGLYSPLLRAGEWWRLFSAQFLHWGVAHLGLNMLGLWYIGRGVEALVGSLRFLLAFLISGAGGMLIAWALATYGPNPRVILLVGASASVLGLVGAQAAISLKAFRLSGSLAAKAQLSAMTQIIVLQAVFDWMVPEVSSTAHLGGALTGFVLGMIFIRARVAGYRPV